LRGSTRSCEISEDKESLLELDSATLFVCVWGTKGYVDVTRIHVEMDNPTTPCNEEVLKDYQTTISTFSVSTSHAFIAIKLRYGLWCSYPRR
jgi:hypothetical protein